jgi:hypothetical protein
LETRGLDQKGIGDRESSQGSRNLVGLGEIMGGGKELLLDAVDSTMLKEDMAQLMLYLFLLCDPGEVTFYFRV